MADGEDGGGGEEGCWDGYVGEGGVYGEEDDGLDKIYEVEGGMGNHGEVLIAVNFGWRFLFVAAAGMVMMMWESEMVMKERMEVHVYACIFVVFTPC